MIKNNLLNLIPTWDNIDIDEKCFISLMYKSFFEVASYYKNDDTNII